MEKSTILFIRACKSRNPEKRIASVYRRVYWDEMDYREGASILIQIIDFYFKMNLSTFVKNTEARMYWYKEDYWKAIFHTAKSIIRLTKAVELPEGYIAPLKFRQGEEL